MIKVIEFTNEKNYINDFLKLPKLLYTKEDNMEGPKNMRSFLLGEHPLSKYFELFKFLVYKDGEVAGRFTMTCYPDDDVCYFGFFECKNDKKVAKALFDAAKKFQKDKKYKRIVGPVDASFWNKYRLKINLFNLRPYTGEPYNKDYYLQLFQDNDFKICEHYTSNIYGVVNDEYYNEMFDSQLKKMTDKGIKVYSPDVSEFNKIIKDLYYLITDLYSDFPIFKMLSLEDFTSIFGSYKAIMNMNMIKVGYDGDKMAGFFVSLPNYNNLVYHLNNPINLLKILKSKKQPKEYVLLYLGADKEHKGLGRALTQAIIDELRISKLPSIGALARDGKVTQNYASDKIEKQYEYVLLEYK